MPKAMHTDMRFNVTRYYDSGGNELDGPDGEIVDWRQMRKHIAALREVLAQIGKARTLKDAKLLAANAPRK